METSRVEHPEYYQLPYGIEVIDIVRGLDFDLGNVIKYTLRAGRKGEQGLSSIDKEIEDLEKAKWYLEDKIADLKKIRTEREMNV